jgi:hypothetical protein
MKKLKTGLIFIFLLCTAISFAQPVWSPEVRAERETQWMKDSLNLSPEQLSNVTAINLDYQRDMDKAAAAPGKTKKQKQIMHRKDEKLVAIFNKEQYSIYMRREKIVRARAKVKYTGPHQPL